MELAYKIKSNKDLEFIYNNMNSLFSCPYDSLGALLSSATSNNFKYLGTYKHDKYIWWIVTHTPKVNTKSIEGFCDKFFQTRLMELL